LDFLLWIQNTHISTDHIRHQRRLFSNRSVHAEKVLTCIRATDKNIQTHWNLTDRNVVCSIYSPSSRRLSYHKVFSDSMNTHPLSWIMWISIAQLLFDATRILWRMHIIYIYIMWVHLCYVSTKYTNVVKYVHFVKICKPYVEWIHNLSDEFIIRIIECYNTRTIDLFYI